MTAKPPSKGKGMIAVAPMDGEHTIRPKLYTASARPAHPKRQAPSGTWRTVSQSPIGPDCVLSCDCAPITYDRTGTDGYFAGLTHVAKAQTIRS